MTFFNLIIFYKFNSNNRIQKLIQLSKPNFNFKTTFFAEHHYAEHHYAEHHYAEHHYAEHHYAKHRYVEHCYAENRYAECIYTEFCGVPTIFTNNLNLKVRI